MENIEKRYFEFSKEVFADEVEVGDTLYDTSAEFNFCAIRGSFCNTSVVKPFIAKEIKSERIIADNPSNSRNGGDYYFYTYEVISLC